MNLIHRLDRNTLILLLSRRLVGTWRDIPPTTREQCLNGIKNTLLDELDGVFADLLQTIKCYVPEDVNSARFRCRRGQVGEMNIACVEKATQLVDEYFPELKIEEIVLPTQTFPCQIRRDETSD